MKISPKTKIFLVLGIFLGLFLALIILLILPFFGQIQENSKTLISQKNKLVSLRQEMKNLEEEEAIYRQKQEGLEKINRLFISAEMPINFITFLENNAAEEQLTINISPAGFQKAGADSWSSLAFQVNLTGNSASSLRFIEKLENSPYLVEITNLNLSRSSALPVSPEIAFSVEASPVSASLSLRVFAK